MAIISRNSSDNHKLFTQLKSIANKTMLLVTALLNGQQNIWQSTRMEYHLDCMHVASGK